MTTVNGLMTTLCGDCFGIADRLHLSDPTRVALVNRIVDFKEAWPLKAKINGLGYAASLIARDKELAVQFTQQVVKGNFTRAIA